MTAPLLANDFPAIHHRLAEIEAEKLERVVGEEPVVEPIEEPVAEDGA